MGQTNLCHIGPLHAAQTSFSCLDAVLIIVEWIHWFVELTSVLDRAHGAKSILLQPMQGVSLTVITSLCCTLKSICFHWQVLWFWAVLVLQGFWRKATKGDTIAHVVVQQPCHTSLCNCSSVHSKNYVKSMWFQFVAFFFCFFLIVPHVWKCSSILMW